MNDTKVDIVPLHMKRAEMMSLLTTFILVKNKRVTYWVGVLDLASSLIIQLSLECTASAILIVADVSAVGQPASVMRGGFSHQERLRFARSFQKSTALRAHALKARSPSHEFESICNVLLNEGALHLCIQKAIHHCVTVCLVQPCTRSLKTHSLNPPESQHGYWSEPLFCLCAGVHDMRLCGLPVGTAVRVYWPGCKQEWTTAHRGRLERWRRGDLFLSLLLGEHHSCLSVVAPSLRMSGSADFTLTVTVVIMPWVSVWTWKKSLKPHRLSAKPGTEHILISHTTRMAFRNLSLTTAKDLIHLSMMGQTYLISQLITITFGSCPSMRLVLAPVAVLLPAHHDVGITADN
ncbi:hypothetical protein T10_13307 [Trichinella papuae]|uniref:Uncharacterized protein n=1 Tax=Trichinella papuae TaxID=268474 RepID=A0A0V1MGM0_9BILA|nr:hypothetical protein T10_13307 [Trichinella papuae]